MKWSKEKTDYLRVTYNAGHPIEQIARSLGVSCSAVTAKSYRMRLRRKRTDAWTKLEDNFLKKHLGAMPVRMISRKLGRSVHAIYSRAVYCGFSR